MSNACVSMQKKGVRRENFGAATPVEQRWPESEEVPEKRWPVMMVESSPC